MIVTLVFVVKSILAIRFLELSRCLRISFGIKMFRFDSVLGYLRENAFENRVVRGWGQDGLWIVLSEIWNGF